MSKKNESRWIYLIIISLTLAAVCVLYMIFYRATTDPHDHLFGFIIATACFGTGLTGWIIKPTNWKGPIMADSCMLLHMCGISLCTAPLIITFLEEAMK